MLKYELDQVKFSDLKDKIEIPKFQRGLVWGDQKKKEFIKSLKAGLPIETPSVTVNVVCGSGLNCVNMAAQMIKAGDADIVVAGGMENMSMAPYAMTKARFGYRMNNATIVDTMVNDALTDAFNHYHMMITAENICDRWNLTREELDKEIAKGMESVKNGKGYTADEVDRMLNKEFGI